MPGWLGGPELVVIVLVIVVLFGWKKLPDAARSLGRSMRIFKSEVDELKRDPSPTSAASQDTVQGNVSNEQRAAAPSPSAEPTEGAGNSASDGISRASADSTDSQADATGRS